MTPNLPAQPNGAPNPGHQLAPLSHFQTALALPQPGSLQQQAEVASDGMTPKDVLRILSKRKWMLISVAIIGAILAGLASYLMRPIYSATTTIQIDKTAAKIVSFNKDFDSNQDGSEERSNITTQLEILKSRSLNERVIDELRLDASGGKAPSGIRSNSSTLSSDKPLRSREISGKLGGTVSKSEAQDESANVVSRTISELGLLDKAQNLWDRLSEGYLKSNSPSVTNQAVLSREAVVGTFSRSVTVTPLRGTRLVRVTVNNADPALAARIANTIAQTYISMNLERRFDSSVYAKTFLEEQIQQVRAKLEDSEKKLNAFTKDRQILTLDEKTAVINDTFSDFSSALNKAEQDRIRAEALYAEVVRNPRSSPQVLASGTIQAYKEQKARLDSEYQTSLKIFKPEFPKMVQLRAQIDDIDNKIEDEIKSVSTSLKGQFDAAKKQENLLRVRLQQTRQQVLVTQDQSSGLNLLRREVDTNRQLYDNLLQRLKEVGVAGGVESNNVSVVDKANVPLFPSTPNINKNLLIGLAAGLFLALLLAFVLEFIDDTVRYTDEVERLIGLPLLGVIPAVKKAVSSKVLALMSHTDPRGQFSEAYRSVRTALQFSTSQGAPKRLVVTSCTKNEGKSTTTLALAINFAQMGKQVLLIDADMRNPTVHRLLSMTNDVGLSNYLSGETLSENPFKNCQIPNLKVMTAGPTPPSPVDLLMGPHLLSIMDSAEAVGIDYIFVDSPPVLGLADALVLGNQVPAMLFVIQASKTRKSNIKDTLRRLRNSGLVPRGIVLTKTTSQNTNYYGYDYDYYGYGADAAEAPKPKLSPVINPTPALKAKPRMVEPT